MSGISASDNQNGATAAKLAFVLLDGIDVMVLSPR